MKSVPKWINMRRNRLSLKLLLFLFLAASMSSITLGQTFAATVSVSPSSVTSPVTQDFIINVTVFGVSDLYGWEITLTWNSTLLEAVGVTEGTFLKSGNRATFFTYNIIATEGSLTVDCTLTGAFNGVNGDGTLATITFYVNSAGGCPLHLSEATLVDSQDNQIPSQTVDGYGYFRLVSSIATLKNVVGQGYSDGVNVTVANDKGDTEAFNVTLYANTTVIGNQTTSNLPNGTFIVLTFSWSTTNFVYGNYTLSAGIWPVQGETNSTSNCPGGNVVVTIPGDVNGDFKVGLSDLVLLGKAYNTKPGDARWNPNADINGDGKIGLSDLTLMGRHYNMRYP
jgi:hypothetical protein